MGCSNLMKIISSGVPKNNIIDLVRTSSLSETEIQCLVNNQVENDIIVAAIQGNKKRQLLNKELLERNMKIGILKKYRFLM